MDPYTGYDALRTMVAGRAFLARGTKCAAWGVFWRFAVLGGRRFYLP